MKVSALHSSATAEDVLNLTRATGLSRFPVYRDRIDEVIGMVHLKDALAVPAPERLRTPAGRIAVPPLLVPGTLPVEALLRRLRHEQPIAVVVDEYGGTAGCRHPGGHHRGARRRGPRRARRRGRRPPRADRRPRRGRQPGVGRRGQLPGAHPAPERPGRARRTLRDRRRARRKPAGPHPRPGDRAELPGWRISVRQVGHNRAERVRFTRAADPLPDRAAPALLEAAR